MPVSEEQFANGPALSSSPASEKFMSSLSPDERRVAEILEHVRQRLLSVSGNNRFLNFKNTAKSFQFSSVDLNRLYKGLVQDGKRIEVISSEQYELQQESNNNNISHGLQLVVDLDIDLLEKRLRRVVSDSKLAIQETGLNILYLTFGTLQWKDTGGASGSVSTAPLVMVPVRLEKGEVSNITGSFRFFISYDGEDVESNVCLREKLQQFGMEWPSFDSFCESCNSPGLPQKYLNYLQHLIGARKDWAICSDVILGFFQFSKLRMYEDLKPERWASGDSSLLNNQLIKDTLLGAPQPDVFTAPEDYDVDHDERADDVPLVVDADSSQHSALVDALSGKNMVIHGPPGTGKSQTITNLIAAALAKGKKVLFVSEKLAALEVVYRNLEKVGLHHYCFQLHSKTANKKEVLASLKARLELSPPNADSIESELLRLISVKERLYGYLKALSVRSSAIGESAYEIFGKSLNYRLQLEQSLSIRIKRVEEMSRDAFDQRCRMMGNLSAHVETYGHLYDGPWHGFYPRTFSLDLKERTEVVLLDISKSLNRTLQAIKSIDCSSLSPEQTDIVEMPALCQGATSLLDNQPHGCSQLGVDLNHEETRDELQSFCALMDQYDNSKRNFSAFEDRVDKQFLRKHVNESVLCYRAIDSWFDHSTPLSNIHELSNLIISFRDVCSKLVEFESVLDPIKSYCSCDKLAEIFKTVDLLGHLELSAGFLKTTSYSCKERAALSVFGPSIKAHCQNLSATKEDFENEFVSRILPSYESSVTLRKSLEGLTHSSFLKKFFVSFPLRHKLSRIRGKKKDVLFSDEADLLRRYELHLVDCSKFQHHPFARSLYGSLFDGFDTSWETLASMDAWVVELAELLTKDCQISDLVHVAETICAKPEILHLRSLAREANDILQALREAMAKCQPTAGLADLPLLSAESTCTDTAKALTPFCSALDAFRSDCSTSRVDDSMSLGEWNAALTSMHANVSAESQILGAAKVQLLLGARFAGVDTDCVLLDSALKWVSRILDADLPDDLKQCLLRATTEEERGRMHDLFAAVINGCSVATDIFANKLSEIAEVNENEFFGKSFSCASFAAISYAISACIENIESLPPWFDYLKYRTDANDMGLQALVSHAENGEVEFNVLEVTFKAIFYTNLSEHLISSNPEFKKFSGVGYEQLRKEFIKVDKKVLWLTRQRLRSAIHGMHHVPPGIATGRVSEFTDRALILREISKKRRHIPVRSLVRRAGKAVQGLKPCFMMSPMSVAQFIPPNSLPFDLVVIDEASQLKPEDALGALARCHQAVVVGDQKQLPPTNFFESFGGADTSDDENPLNDLDSILDAFVNNYPGRRLKWHYRSLHQDLIRFSNERYYNNELLIFPTPDTLNHEYGIKHHYIEDGQFAGSSRGNINEATAVAHAILKHVRECPQYSLGVVAMNLHQQHLIEDCLDMLVKNDRPSAFALARFNKEHDEKESSAALFIKNLESVQGDERDVIMISSTYGPEPVSKKVFQRFGPVNNAGGERRLNVLLSRSRVCMELYTSMKSSDIVGGPSASQGARDLKAFIQFAESGKIVDSAHVSERPPDSDFEIAVAREITKLGYTVDCQYGVAGFFIDLAVRRPGGGHILGVECDGAAYHSSRSARDRDRIRESVLKSRGWRIHRIWSTDWFTKCSSELARLKMVLSKASEI